MDRLLKDIRFGVRSLLKHPGFTALVIVTLALGIGASTAIFSVVNTVLLRRLPYRQSERIVAIRKWTNTESVDRLLPPTFSTGGRRTLCLNSWLPSSRVRPTLLQKIGPNALTWR